MGISIAPSNFSVRPVDPVRAKRRAKRAALRESGRREIDWTPAYRSGSLPVPAPTRVDRPTVRYGRPSDVLAFIDRFLPSDTPRPVVTRTVIHGRPADVLRYIDEILGTVPNGGFGTAVGGSFTADDAWDRVNHSWARLNAIVTRNYRDQTIASRALNVLNADCDRLIAFGVTADEIRRRLGVV